MVFNALPRAPNSSLRFVYLSLASLVKSPLAKTSAYLTHVTIGSLRLRAITKATNILIAMKIKLASNISHAIAVTEEKTSLLAGVNPMDQSVPFIG